MKKIINKYIFKKALEEKICTWKKKITSIELKSQPRIFRQHIFFVWFMDTGCSSTRPGQWTKNNMYCMFNTLTHHPSDRKLCPDRKGRGTATRWWSPPRKLQTAARLRTAAAHTPSWQSAGRERSKIQTFFFFFTYTHTERANVL